MGFWSSLGTLAKQFAEYALAQKLAAAVPQPPATPAPQPAPVPTQAPVSPVPAAPVVPSEADMRKRVEVLYKQYLNRSRSDITNAEMDEAMDLLLIGREDELIADLRGRAGLPAA